LKIDIGLVYKGFFLDMARTFCIGQVTPEAKKLVAVTEECFWRGIENLKEGAFLSDYSRAAEECAREAGFSVVKNLVGHGIGRNLHEDPIIPNFFCKKYEDIRLVSGMTLAFEPMINVGTHLTVLGRDGWVFRTKDQKLSAHYENTVLITEQGTEVLTYLKK
jgi:methionyl aminopeptidase